MDKDLINKTFDVIDYFHNHETFKTLIKLNQALESDELKPLMDLYKTTKKAYLDAKKYSSFHPDLKTLQKAYQQAKNDLYYHPIMKDYVITFKTFQEELDDFVSSIGTLISPKIKIQRLPSLR
jgi:cell fate (sporulation/competence/biofilm development) regulator YlbF (YheA/YmcA/DUF963 family)